MSTAAYQFLQRASLPMLLMVFALLLLLGPVDANQTIQSPPCPSSNEISSELTIRKEKLIKLRSGLEDFMAGKVVLDIPLTVLFMIDLNDAEAVAKRVEALKQTPSLAKDEINNQDPVLNCALASGEFQDAAKNIIDLQQSISDLRLQFLTLEPEKRAAILHPKIEANTQANTVKQLQEERNSAIEAQQQAAKSLAHVEQQELLAEPGPTGDLVADLAELQRTKTELTSLQLKWVSELEQDATFYQEITERLAEIGKFLVQPDLSSKLKTEYELSVAIWRTLVDKTHKVVNSRNDLKLPSLPDYPEKILTEIGDTPKTREYKETYNKTKLFKESLQEKIGTRLEESVDRHYRVLLQSGEIRSQLLNQLLDHNDYSPLTFSKKLFEDIRREFVIVPYRWSATFYLRTLEVRRNLNQGWDGLKQTTISLLVLLLFCLIPWVIWIGIQRLTLKLNQLRIALVARSKTHSFASKLALLVQKILPYSAWLVILLALYLAQLLLQLTVFAELSLLLPYIRYYIYYRLFRQLMQCDFIWINRQIKAAKLWGLRRRVDVVARALGLTAFLIFSLLTAIESLIRRGLVYHFATQFMLDLGFLILMGFSFQWREVIAASLAKQIHGQLGEQLAALCNSRWGFLFAIPGFLVLVIIFLLKLLGNWSNHFEVTKRIAAEVFRYRLESSIDKDDKPETGALPLEYQLHFSLTGSASPDQLKIPALEGLSEVCRILANWSLATSQINSLAIIGHKGAGKTCLLDYLAKQAPAVQIVRSSVPTKLTGRKQVLDFFSELLNIPPTQNTSEWLDTANLGPKTLILLDEAHNLFLSSQCGFEGYHVLLELISRPIPNLFWCFSFNHYAWTYLNSVNARHQYIDVVIRLTPWSEHQIQELILSMHNKTAFRLSYDDILQAAGSDMNRENVTYIENRFFSLLRQQSKGNPRLAVYLWLSSLRKVGNQELRVGLPDEPDTILLSDLSEDALFVLASIARHENLTLAQTVAVTQLPEGVVRHVLELTVRQNLLQCDECQVYRLAILYQYPMIHYLLAKHCLYE